MQLTQLILYCSPLFIWISLLFLLGLQDFRVFFPFECFYSTSWPFIFLNGGVKTTELKRHGTYHPPFLSRRQRRRRRKSSFSLQYRDQYTGLSELLYICLLLPDPYLHIRIVLTQEKLYQRIWKRTLPVSTTTAGRRVQAEGTHTTSPLFKRNRKAEQRKWRYGTSQIMVQCRIENTIRSLMLFQL